MLKKKQIRGKRKYIYYLSDIAEIKNVSINTIYSAIQRKRLNPRSLKSVIDYCTTDLRKAVKPHTAC